MLRLETLASLGKRGPLDQCGSCFKADIRDQGFEFRVPEFLVYVFFCAFGVHQGSHNKGLRAGLSENRHEKTTRCAYTCGFLYGKGEKHLLAVYKRALFLVLSSLDAWRRVPNSLALV